ncbi:MAG: SRPBCC family protein [Acidobacteriota bacterium]
MATRSELILERSIVLAAPPARVLDAFFDHGDLREWWQVWRSVTVPRPLGAYSLEWGPSARHDQLLGRLGGAFHGTVLDYHAGIEFFVADAYWTPPDGDPIGPMALEVRCTGHDRPHTTRLDVRQGAENQGPRWQRYFGVAGEGWDRALPALKTYLEASRR